MSWPTVVVLVMLMICLAEVMTAALIWGGKPARKPGELWLGERQEHQININGLPGATAAQLADEVTYRQRNQRRDKDPDDKRKS